MTNQKQYNNEGLLIIFMFFACLVVGVWLGMDVGKTEEQQRIVIDQQHLIYDHVLYKKVVPDE